MPKREKPNPFSSKSRQQPVVDLRSHDDDEEYDDFDAYGDPYGNQEDEYKVFGLGIASADDRQPTYGQGIVFALIIAAALLLAAIIAIGDGDGSLPPMLQRSSLLLWIVCGIALLLAAAGAQYSEVVTARAAEEEGAIDRVLRTSTAWVVPFVSVFAAALLIATYHNRWMLLFGPLLAFVGMAGSLLSRDLLDEAEEPGVRTASVINSVIGVLVAFFAFSAVYLNKFSAVIAVPLVIILTMILLLEALERTTQSGPRRVLNSVLGAWVMAAAMLALNWWPISGWGGGVVLTAMFYMVYGMLVTNAEGITIDRRKMIEFVGVGSLVMVFVALKDVFF